jgi:hypothetical protein
MDLWVSLIGEANQSIATSRNGNCFPFPGKNKAH